MNVHDVILFANIQWKFDATVNHGGAQKSILITGFLLSQRMVCAVSRARTFFAMFFILSSIQFVVLLTLHQRGLILVPTSQYHLLRQKLRGIMKFDGKIVAVCLLWFSLPSSIVLLHFSTSQWTSNSSTGFTTVIWIRVLGYHLYPCCTVIIKWIKRKLADISFDIYAIVVWVRYLKIRDWLSVLRQQR